MNQTVKTKSETKIPQQNRTALIDPKSLMKIKSMELRAKVIVEGFWRGIHRSPYHGFSVEFTEYRRYTAGDDTRHIDWRLFARSDRLYIKKFEDETNLRCHLLVDQSKSMNYGTLDYTKSHYGATLAATLARFLFTQGDAVGLSLFDDKLKEMIPPRNRSGHLNRIMVALEQETSGNGTDLTAPLDAIMQKITQRSMIIIISDLLAPLDKLQTQLDTLAAYGHEVIIFQVLDPTEINFNFESAAHFKDLETDEIIFLEPKLVKEKYQIKFKAHCDKIAEICGRSGIDYYQFSTDRPFDEALLTFMQSHNNKLAMRRRR